MATVKTAISLPEEVFRSFDDLARRTGRSRSGMITAALEKYLEDLETSEILHAIDEAYADIPPNEADQERRLRERMGRLAVDTLNANGDIWEPDR